MQAHCDGGAWVGGEWVPLEQCAQQFMLDDARSAKVTSQFRDLSSKCDAGRVDGGCKNCPRSRSKFVAADPKDGSYDVVIIGAGCVGSCVARELAKTKARVLLLEAADDVTQGATKGNSGIVHAGYDDKPGSVRSKFCNPGCRMFPQLDKELHFGFQRNGSIVIAKTAAEERILERLLAQGAANGVANLRIIDQDELRRIEPEVHPDARKALLAEDAGTIVPYEFCVAVAENAIDNGVELRLRREVVSIEKHDSGFTVHARHWEPNLKHPVPPLRPRAPAVPWFALCLLAVAGAVPAIYFGVPFLVYGAICFVAQVLFYFFAKSASAGSASNVAIKEACSANWAPSNPAASFTPSPGTVFESKDRDMEAIRCRFVVNAAGCNSDGIAKMLGDDSFEVNPRLGDYVLLHKNEGKRARHTIFPCPDPVKGKGVLVQNTLWGNLILGPTARDTKKKDPKTGRLVPNDEVLNESNASIIASVLTKCKELVPSFKAAEVIHSFCGARAKTTRGDWIIEPCATAPRCIHAAGIDSPGLAGSPAIALEVVRLLKAAGCNLLPDADFNPLRAPVVTAKRGFKDYKGRAIKCGKPGTIKDPKEYIICKCERVTEADVIEACRRSIPIDNTQAVRRRTRAGMGHCQGDPSNYSCEDRVAAIIAREMGIPEEDVGRRPWPASSLMPRRIFTAEDKTWVEGLAETQ